MLTLYKWTSRQQQLIVCECFLAQSFLTGVNFNQKLKQRIVRHKLTYLFNQPWPFSEESPQNWQQVVNFACKYAKGSGSCAHSFCSRFLLSVQITRKIQIYAAPRSGLWCHLGRSEWNSFPRRRAQHPSARAKQTQSVCVVCAGCGSL